MNYKCNADYKTAKGMPFNLGACTSCRYNANCEYKQDRIKIIDSIEDTIKNLKRETPVMVEITCRQFRVDLGD